VFTPRAMGGLRDRLHRVDFAYRIQLRGGQSPARAVRINDRLCPLPTPLQNVDFVQVSHQERPPDLDCFNFVGTPTARNRNSSSGYKRSIAHEGGGKRGRGRGGGGKPNSLRAATLLRRELGATALMPAQWRGDRARWPRRCQSRRTPKTCSLHSLRRRHLHQVLTACARRSALATDKPPPGALQRGSGALVEAGRNTGQPRHQRQRDPCLERSRLPALGGNACCRLPAKHRGKSCPRQAMASPSIAKIAPTYQIPVERRLAVHWNPPTPDP